MKELKNDIEQVKVQLLTGIKLGRVNKEWGNMIIETCNRALTIHSVGKSFYCYNKLQGFNHSLCEVSQCKKCKELEQ